MITESQQLVAMLKPFVQDIKDSAACGNPHAKQIINLYELHRACPSDPGAIGLCHAAFELWRAQHEYGQTH